MNDIEQYSSDLVGYSFHDVEQDKVNSHLGDKVVVSVTQNRKGNP